MGMEIERRFIVLKDRWQTPGGGLLCRQGYLSLDPDRVVRVRIMGDRAWLTLKGRGDGLAHPEYEYPLPLTDARQILAHLCHQPLIEKIRYNVQFKNHAWVVDVFQAANRGLILAEIELAHADETFARPEWLGAEVSEDPRYLNVHLVRRPFGSW